MNLWLEDKLFQHMYLKGVALFQFLRKEKIKFQLHARKQTHPPFQSSCILPFFGGLILSILAINVNDIPKKKKIDRLQKRFFKEKL